MSKVHHVLKARKDIPSIGLKAGESYYWWQLYKRPKQYSKTPPKPSQLTGSEFLSSLRGLEEQLGDIDPGSYDQVENMQMEIEAIKNELENLKGETEDKLSNMPDSLQQAPTGELLQNRVDSLDTLASDLDALGYEEPSDEDVDDAAKEDAGEGKEVTSELREETRKRLVADKCQELLDEASGLTWDIE